MLKGCLSTSIQGLLSGGSSMIGRRSLGGAISRPLPHMLRALRHRNFRLFWLGQLVSLVGSWMQALALQWLVYQITGSALAMGTIAALMSLPVLLIGPLAGVLVDRYSRRHVIIGTQISAMLLALSLAWLTFGDHAVYWHVVVFALFYGTITAIDMPARQAFLSEMVPDRDDLLNAIGLNTSVFNAARIVGPAVAGILVGLVGLGWAFLINGLSFCAVLWGLLLMRDLPVAERDAVGTTAFRSFIDGCRYAVSTPLIRAILILVLVPSVWSFAYIMVLPIIADQVLVTPMISEGATRLGVLMTANGCGALIGALRVASLPAAVDRRALLLQGGIAFGIGQILFALNRSFWVALPIIALMGFGMITFLANANATLQISSSERMRGRVMSFYITVLVGLRLIGDLQAGWIAEHWGATTVVLIGGVLCVLTMVAGRRSTVLNGPGE